MTIEAAAEFINKISADEALMAELGTALSGTTDADGKCAVLATLGAQHGHDFTAEEAMMVRTAVRAEAAQNAPDAGIELSDNELEIISGGGPVLAGVAAGIGIAAGTTTLVDNLAGEGTSMNAAKQAATYTPGSQVGFTPIRDLFGW